MQRRSRYVIRKRKSLRLRKIMILLILIVLCAGVVFSVYGLSRLLGKSQNPNSASSLASSENQSAVSQADSEVDSPAEESGASSALADSSQTISSAASSADESAVQTSEKAVQAIAGALTPTDEAAIQASEQAVQDASSSLQSVEVSESDAVKPYHIKVSLSAQQVTVLDKNNRVVKCFLCSTGLTGYDTPKGTYKVSSRGKSFYSTKYAEGAYYWVSFYGNYLFHSIPFDKDKHLELSEAEKLGQPASHGCVRLPVDAAKWIYDNIPDGTSVLIQ